MKNVLLIALALAASIAFAADPAPGSANAIKVMVPSYLGKLLTIMDEPVISGNHAKVHAKILTQDCHLVLARHATANEFGWVIERHECSESSSTAKK